MSKDDSKKLTIERKLERIMTDNRMGIKISKAALARMLSDRTGKRVWPYYIKRWESGKVSCYYRKVLAEVYEELCDANI